MPFVDCRVELKAGIRASPSGLANFSEQNVRFVSIACFPAYAIPRIPFTIFDDFVHEVIAESHGIVRILTRDSLIRFTIEIGWPTFMNQRLSFFLFLCFPLDKIQDLRMGQTRVPVYG